MKRFVGVLFVLLVLTMTPAVIQTVDAEDEGPNLQVPEDFPEKARDSFDKAMQIFEDLKNPANYPQGYKRPAERMQYQRLNEEKLDKAIKEMEKAKKSASGSHLPPYYLCIFFQWKSDFNGGAEKWVGKAENMGETAMDKLDGFYEAALELADIYMRLKKYKKAIGAYDDAREMSGGALDDNEQLYNGRMSSHIALEEWDEAKKAWEGWQAAKPDMPDAMKENVDMLFHLTDMGTEWAPYNHETDHYAVHTNVSQAEAEATAEMFEVAYKFFSKLFGQKPKRKELFHIHVFNGRNDFHAKTKAPSFAGGFYQPATQMLYYPKIQDAALTKSVAYHEGFHQFLDAVTIGIPSWFNEGHAEFFAPSKYLTDGGARMELQVNQMRLKALRQAMQQGQAPTVEDLIFSGPPEFSQGGPVMGIYYAAGWSFAYFCWMHEGGKYKQIVINIVKNAKKGYAGPELMKKSFGSVDLDALTDEWRKYVGTLR